MVFLLLFFLPQASAVLSKEAVSPRRDRAPHRCCASSSWAAASCSADISLGKKTWKIGHISTGGNMNCPRPRLKVLKATVPPDHVTADIFYARAGPD